MKDIWASIVIFLQNFEARYGAFIYALFLSFLFIILAVALIRTVRAGRRAGKRVELRERKADPVLRERAAEKLCGMIRFRTLSKEKEQVQALFAYMHGIYPQVFSEAALTIVPEGVLLKINGRGGGKPPVLFCGHLDVAPAGDGWEHEPFAAERVDGKIYGRGACDCKGPVSALFEALESDLKADIRPERDIYVALGLDEELNGRGAERIAAKLREEGLSFDLILDAGGYIAKSHMESRDYPISLIGVGDRENS